MISKREIAAVCAMALVGGVAACAPTIRLQVDPIQIYAKLDADVRIRLDQELRQLLEENPNLF
ncbi:YnbE family lipoprotein [Brevundimonas sp.]|uniref:YnbE family lipoprotein n=1 Tax=Brevundimonas sp. TaxID=1871086 RepID=UPI00391B973C